MSLHQATHLPAQDRPDSGENGNFHLVVLPVMDTMAKKATDLPMATLLRLAVPLKEGYLKYLLFDYPQHKEEC